MDAGLVCDHLTENRSNNYSWALAMVPNNFNATFGERSAIAKPYFFYTVWDKKSFCYRIKFGADDGVNCWEQRYSLMTLDEQTTGGKYAYKEMFIAFLKKIGSQYASTEAETYLRHWSDPKYAYDVDNPLIVTLKEPIEVYSHTFSANSP